MIHPTEAIVIQRVVARAFGDPVGVRDMRALEAALARPFALKNGIPAYPTFLNKASVLFQGLLMAKPFAGANRRTSLCILALVLQSKGYRLDVTAGDLGKMLPAIELGFASWHRVTVWLKGRVRRVAPGQGAGERA